MKASPHILAIESSCDETSAAVIRGTELCSNIIATQDIHRQYGGVVPELASRAHMEHIVPVVDTALKKAGLTARELDAVAFTQSPGLIGALLVGACFAKGMAQALRIPLIAVNHLQAHVLAHWIDTPQPQLPFLCLTVSGGHTQLVLVRSPLDMQRIGTTLDDAAGEAFDKIAKMIGLPYPGGPLIDKLAATGNREAFSFPVSDMPGYDFSFSGLKTAVLYFLRKQQQADPDFIEQRKSDICASVQHTIIQSLMKKLRQAADDLQIDDLGIAGGVSANSGLRAALESFGRESGRRVYLPKFEYCTDNAAMIAMTAHFKMLGGQFSDLSAVPSARANW